MPAGTCIRSFAAGEAHIRVPFRDQRRPAAHHVPPQTGGWHGTRQRGEELLTQSHCLTKPNLRSPQYIVAVSNGMTQNHPPVEELMSRAANGDNTAYAMVAGRMQDHLYRMALSQGMCGHDAADIVQETLLRAYERLDVWQAGNNTRCWLLGIAMNVIREGRRKRARHFAFDITTLAITASGAEITEPLDDPETLEILSAALAGLPQRQHEVITCRYLNQLDVRQTAEVMGCAEGTVKAATAAALENLRKAMRSDE